MVGGVRVDDAVPVLGPTVERPVAAMVGVVHGGHALADAVTGVAGQPPGALHPAHHQLGGRRGGSARGVAGMYE